MRCPDMQLFFFGRKKRGVGTIGEASIWSWFDVFRIGRYGLVSASFSSGLWQRVMFVEWVVHRSYTVLCRPGLRLLKMRRGESQDLAVLSTVNTRFASVG